MNKNEQGQWMWIREDVESHGLRYAGLTFPDSHHYRMHHICKQLDVTLDSVQMFRIAPEQWEVYYRPEVTKGYVQRGVLEGAL